MEECMLGNATFDLVILPRVEMSRKQFIRTTPKCSIGLDGVVKGGPFFDEESLHANYDHHDRVVREATMSSCKQIYRAIKSGLMEGFRINGRPHANIFINDPDQDTSAAVWLLHNYNLFEGTQTIPSISRLIEITDAWDITAGSYPFNLREELVRQLFWVYQPYTDLRKSGVLADADASLMRTVLEAVMNRITKLMMGQAEGKDLDTRHEILYENPVYKIINETGGNEARYYLFTKGLNAYVSLVARRKDSRYVWSIGRRSQYIPFPVKDFYHDLNEAEGLPKGEGWGGSDIVGGSSRLHGSKLGPMEIAEILNYRLKIKGLMAAA